MPVRNVGGNFLQLMVLLPMRCNAIDLPYLKYITLKKEGTPVRLIYMELKEYQEKLSKSVYTKKQFKHAKSLIMNWKRLVLILMIQTLILMNIRCQIRDRQNLVNTHSRWECSSLWWVVDLVDLNIKEEGHLCLLRICLGLVVQEHQWVVAHQVKVAACLQLLALECHHKINESNVLLKICTNYIFQRIYIYFVCMY